ncbi:Utrophin [Bienertia sinuspersici]
MLRKQQFQQQQQQQQQQREQQFTAMDMKRIMALLLDDNNENKVTSNSLAQVRQPETVANVVNTTDSTPDDQVLNSLLFTNNEDLLSWDALLNIDDFQGDNWTY